jgi:formylglycine-generating enzyme required for sulfatase activity
MREGGYGAHPATVSAFYMDSVDVTQADYQTLMGVNPSRWDTGGVSTLRKPVEMVTWFDAVLYCNKRSIRDGYDTVYSYTSKTMDSMNSISCDSLANLAYDFTRHGYRLPTEAEWEYACHAGSTSFFYWGWYYNPWSDAEFIADTIEINAHAWWQYNNSPYCTKPVATKPLNVFHLYDMAGNVWQWCNDWYGEYPDYRDWRDTVPIDPTGPSTGSYRVQRGGSWLESWDRDDLTLAPEFRNSSVPNYRDDHTGFRCVRR